MTITADNTGRCGTSRLTFTPPAGSASYYITWASGLPANVGDSSPGVAQLADPTGTPGSSDTATVYWWSGPGRTGAVVLSESLTFTYGTTAPSAPSAASGLGVVNTMTGVTLSWVAGSGANSYAVYRDGTYVKNVGGTSTTDTAPGAHNYYVIAQASTLCGTASSSASSTVSSDAAPNAPTLTGPSNGSTINQGGTQRFTWLCSFVVFGDAQSKFDYRYSSDSGATWTTVTGATPNQFFDAVGGTFAVGNYEWQVRVYGALGKVSPWSASGFFTVAIAPAGPTITHPIDGGTVNAVDHLDWSGADQDDYQYQHVADAEDGSADTSTVYVDSLDVPDAVSRTVPQEFGTNNRWEHVRLRTKYDDLWSSWSDVRVHVSYTGPNVPLVEIEVDDVDVDLGNGETITAHPSMTLSWTTQAGSGDIPDAAYTDVLLSTDGGVTSQRVATLQPVNGSWPFRTPASGVEYWFAVVAFADNGASSTSGWVSYEADTFGSGLFGAGVFGGAT